MEKSHQAFLCEVETENLIFIERTSLGLHHLVEKVGVDLGSVNRKGLDAQESRLPASWRASPMAQWVKKLPETQETRDSGSIPGRSH